MRIRSFDAFDDLRRTVSESSPPPAPPDPFHSLEWFELLARHGMDAPRLHLLLAGESLALPLHWQGNSLASLGNFYSGLFGPMEITGIMAGAGGSDNAAGGAADNTADGAATTWQVVCAHLRAARPRPAVINLKPLDAQGAFFSDMRRSLATAGYWVDSYFCFGNWTYATAGCNFSDYFAQRPSALRNTVRRARHKLDGAGSWHITIHTTAGPDLDAAINQYETIYARSWKSAESYPGFIRALCQLAAQQGWLRLGVLTLGDKPVASQLWLFCAGTSYIFKLAYDPDAARYSPGSVLTAAMMEHAIDQDHAREIDYLSGDDAYKRDWMSQRRERVGLIAFDPATPRGLFAGLRHFGGHALKKLLGKTA